MIVKFKIKNFKSYREESELSFLAQDSDVREDNVTTLKLRDGTTLRLLNTLVLFGANASGKSNIIRALGTLCHLVTDSRTFDMRRPLLEYEPFAFTTDEKKQPTEMTLDFTVDGNRYVYDLAFDHLVKRESLTLLEGDKELLVYRTRQHDDGYSVEVGEGYRSNDLDLSGVTYLGNHLFLSEIGNREVNGLQPIYRAIADMDVRSVGDVISLREANHRVAEMLHREEGSDLFDRLKKLIHVADLGINDIKIQEHTEDDFRFPDSVAPEWRKRIVEQNRWEFHTVHKGGTLHMEQESTGTQNMFGIGAHILHALETGGVIAFDELNLSMHSALFCFIVNLFHDPRSNPRHAQLLFTTHDASVASECGMRADQIWFTEKDESGASELFSACDFEGVPLTAAFGEWYRAGRFGALPEIGTIDYLFGKEHN